MNDNEGPARGWDHALDRLVADATVAAYAVALQYRATNSWVDLQLGLWDAMARTVRDWAGHPLPGPEPSASVSRKRKRSPQTGTAFAALHQEKE